MIWGTITPEVLKRVDGEFENATKKGHTVCFVIASEGGIYNDAARKFIEKISTHIGHVSSKIYSAHSLAAMIALSTKHRTIHPEGEIVIHDGELSGLSASIVDSEGKIPTIIHKSLIESKERNKKILESCIPGISKEEEITYQMQGRLQLNALRCLAAGLVHEIE